MKTYSTSQSEVRRTWHVLDAAGVPLGRLASEVATLIRGKHKVTYAPHLDTGDYVVVLNAAQVALTGRKREQKRYYHHSQYPSGLRTRTVREEQERNPARVIEHAVFGMLPHNRLGRVLHGHLKVYPGADHPHTAQVSGPAQPALSQPPREGRRKQRTPTRRAPMAVESATVLASATERPVSEPSATSSESFMMEREGMENAMSTQQVPEEIVGDAAVPAETTSGEPATGGAAGEVASEVDIATSAPQVPEEIVGDAVIPAEIAPGESATIGATTEAASEAMTEHPAPGTAEHGTEQSKERNA